MTLPRPVTVPRSNAKATAMPATMPTVMPTAMQATMIRARRIFDGDSTVLDDGAVLVVDGLIAAVGPRDGLEAPDGVQVIDLGDATLLPGLIDVHQHLTFPGDARVVQQVLAHDTETMLAQGRSTAAALLAAGITTVRDLGALGDTAFRLADDITRGTTPGPDVITSTAQLTPAGGPNAALGGGCADLAAARARIDRDREQGARVVKVIATGSITDTATDPTQPVFDDATVRGIVVHAHDLGMRVAAHAHGSAGIAQAARCGVDTIEHASFLGRAPLVDRGVSTPGLTSILDPVALSALDVARPWIVPTLTATFAHSQMGRATPESNRDLAHRMTIGRTLLEHGLPIAAGTDGGGPGTPHLGLFVEIELLRDLGMSTAQAVAAATGHAAACLGLPDRGTIRPGLRADLLAVPGNPLDDLYLLRAPSLVLTGGRIVHYFTD